MIDGIGVDGARGGWLTASLSGRTVQWALVPSFTEVLHAAGSAPVAADMPIGLVDAGDRPVDLAGRAWLRSHGGPASSIFLTPPRPVLADRRADLSYTDALAAARARGGKGFSKQAWYLLPRIAEVEDVLVGGAADVLEAHPECAFRRLGTVTASKKSADGLAQRRSVLAALALPSSVPAGAGWDDALDATVLAVVARRWAAGEDVLIADDGTDALGLPMRLGA